MKNLFKGNKISLVACGLILSSSIAFGADSIDGAFKEGKASGSLTAYGIKTDAKGGTANTDTGYATATVSYDTASYMGLSAKMSYIAGHAMSDGSLDNDALMTEAYIKYANDSFSLSAGRQSIDLEWLGDFNESVVAAITAIPDTTIVLGYTNQQAAADEDEIGDFSQVNGENGAYVLDAKYSGVKGLELNPYFYSAPDLADFYGLKATYSTDMFAVTAQYADSSVDSGADESIANIEGSLSIAGLSLALGYVKTDKDNGADDIISAFGDNVSPFDNGANTYASDAKTLYTSLGYSVAGVDLGLLYGETDFGTSSEEKELNLSVGYSISDSLSLGLLYVDYDLEGSSNEDFNSTSATLTYSF